MKSVGYSKPVVLEATKTLRGYSFVSETAARSLAVRIQAQPSQAAKCSVYVKLAEILSTLSRNSEYVATRCRQRRWRLATRGVARLKTRRTPPGGAGGSRPQGDPGGWRRVLARTSYPWRWQTGSGAT